MTRRAIVSAAGFVLAAVLVWWLLFRVVPRWYRGEQAQPQDAPAATSADPQRKITATLYYVSEDGLTLVPAHQDVPFGEPVVEQARRILEAQLGTAPQGFVSAIPDGTKLRALYLSDRGDIFVDLTAEAASKHPGGAANELLTIYTIVNAVTVNLPAITRVQILVDGNEVDTLAGHVDLRNPLSKNLTWVKAETSS